MLSCIICERTENLNSKNFLLKKEFLNENCLNENYVIDQNSIACSSHFDELCFLKHKNRLLQRNTFPSVISRIKNMSTNDIKLEEVSPLDDKLSTSCYSDGSMEKNMPICIIIPNYNMENQYPNHLIDHNYFIRKFPEQDHPQQNSNNESDNLIDIDSEEEVNDHNENAINCVPVGNIDPICLQRAVTYETQPGVQQNSIIYVDNLGYKYYKNIKTKYKVYLVCQNRKILSKNKCPVGATISVDINDRQILTTLNHNHLPPAVNNPIIKSRRKSRVVGTSSSKMPNSVTQLDNHEITVNLEDAKNNILLQSNGSVTRMHSDHSDSSDTVENLPDTNEPRNESTQKNPSSRCVQGLLKADGETVGAIILNVDAIIKHRGKLLTVSIAEDGTIKTVP